MQYDHHAGVRFSRLRQHYATRELPGIDVVARGKYIGEIAEDITLIDILDPFKKIERIGRIRLQGILQLDCHGLKMSVHDRLDLRDRVHNELRPDVLSIDIFIEFEDDLLVAD